MNRRTMHVLSRLAALAACLAPLAALAACQAARPFTGPTATPGPTAPHIELSASATSLRVGDEVTITGLAEGFGLAEYRINLSSGGEIYTNRENYLDIRKPDPLFEVVSVTGRTYDVELVLRAVRPGTATLEVGVSGEITEYWQGKEIYRWDVSSDTVDFTIVGAPAPVAAPTARATATPGPHIELSASATSLRVGDEVTITGLAEGFDQAGYCVYLSSGGEICTGPDNRTDIGKPDTLFEVVSVTHGSGRVELVLRARKAGKSTLEILVSGRLTEMIDGKKTYRWTASRDTLDFTISEAGTPAN